MLHFELIYLIKLHDPFLTPFAVGDVIIGYDRDISDGTFVDNSKPLPLVRKALFVYPKLIF